MVATVEVIAEHDGDRARVAAAGSFILRHATATASAIASAEAAIAGCRSVEVDLANVSALDGSGAVQLAGFLNRLEAAGPRTHVVPTRSPESERLLALYRGQPARAADVHSRTPRLARLGSMVAKWPRIVTGVLDFTGLSARAIPGTFTSPRSVDWKSLPGLVQSIGADGVFVTGSASLLVGLIIGFLGVSQLARFGATIYVPELVVVAQFRELGPLVTAIVVAGRSGAGLASEIATMKVSEEIDALQAMGFDPMRWLVVPRCLALMITMPLLTLIGNVLALAGGLAATMSLTDMTWSTYVREAAEKMTGQHLLVGLVKTPFLGLAIGLIACGQGLATHGGAAAVGTRTTSAVVLSILAVIGISAVFTFFAALVGI